MAKPGKKGRTRSKASKANGGDKPVFDNSDAGAGEANKGPAPGHNIQAVADAVEEAKAEIRQAMADRDALLAQAKACNKRIASGYRKIKSVAGIDRVQMQRALEVEDMEPDAREAALEQQAKAYFFAGLGKQFADAYNAAAPGEQIDMLKVAGAEPRESGSNGTFTEEAAYQTGMADGKSGKRTHAADYERNPKLKELYGTGYMAGTRANLPEQASAPTGGDPFGPAETTTH